MKLKMIILLGVFSLALLAACGPSAAVSPTEAPEAVYTRVAATVQMNMTQTALAMPTSTPTSEPTALPTATATIVPLPTIPQQTMPTLTSQAPVVVQPTIAQNLPGDHAQWMGQNPIDGYITPPIVQFQISWRLKNTGTTTWTTDYYLGFLGGAQIWGVTKVNLEYEVPPGKYLDIYITGFAPEKPASTSPVGLCTQVPSNLSMRSICIFTWKIGPLDFQLALSGASFIYNDCICITGEMECQKEFMGINRPCIVHHFSSCWHLLCFCLEGRPIHFHRFPRLFRDCPGPG